MRKLNETTLLSRLKPASLKIFLICGALLTALSFPRTMAGNDMKEITPPSCCNCGEKDWTIELGTGVAWSNVRSGEPNAAYTLVPVSLTASLKLDDVSLDDFLGGWLRGYSEFYFRGDYDPIVHGPENHYEGLMAGPRYNFVQPGWKIIPFVEGGVLKSVERGRR